MFPLQKLARKEVMQEFANCLPLGLYTSRLWKTVETTVFATRCLSTIGGSGRGGSGGSGHTLLSPGTAASVAYAGNFGENVYKYMIWSDEYCIVTLTFLFVNVRLKSSMI